MKVIHISEFVDYPLEACPYCDEHKLYLEFDETEEDGTPTDLGTHVHCENELDIDDPNYDPRDHSEMPYVNWLPVQKRAAEWAITHIRIVWHDDHERLADWKDGKPLPGGMKR